MLTADLLEEKAVPEEMGTNSVIKPAALASVLGTRLRSWLKKGDLLVWAQLDLRRLGAPGSLTRHEVMEVVGSHRQELKQCQSLGQGEGRLNLGWKVSAAGEPYDLAPIGEPRVDDPRTKCVLEAVAGWKFPAHPEPTPDIDFPIVFRH